MLPLGVAVARISEPSRIIPRWVSAYAPCRQKAPPCQATLDTWPLAPCVCVAGPLACLDVTMTTPAAVVEVPASLLKRALVQLDRDEGMRLTAAVAGHRQNKEDGDVYSACAYTLNASTSRANQAKNRWANIYACGCNV